MMHFIITLTAFQTEHGGVKGWACRMPAIALDSVPVRSALAESRASVFSVKTVSVKIGHYWFKR